MKSHWLIRLISLALSLVLLLQMVPAQSYAAAASESGSAAQETTGVQTQDAAEVPVTLLGEDATLRTQTQKHFRLSDGSSLAVN